MSTLTTVSLCGLANDLQCSDVVLYAGYSAVRQRLPRVHIQHKVMHCRLSLKHTSHYCHITVVV